MMALYKEKGVTPAQPVLLSDCLLTMRFNLRVLRGCSRPPIELRGCGRFIFLEFTTCPRTNPISSHADPHGDQPGLASSAWAPPAGIESEFSRRWTMLCRCSFNVPVPVVIPSGVGRVVLAQQHVFAIGPRGGGSNATNYMIGPPRAAPVAAGLRPGTPTERRMKAVRGG